MLLDKTYRSLERAVSRVSGAVNSVGVGVLVVMMLLVTTDVVLRYFLNQPIKGTFELIEFMMVVVVVLGMAYTGVRKGHVAVEVVVSRFSPRVQALISSFNWLVSLGLFFLISWKGVEYAMTLWESGLTSSQLYVPVFPFVLVLAFGAGLLGLVFLVNFIESVSQVVRK